MAKYKVEYSVNDPTGSGAGYKSSRTIEAKSPTEAKQLFKQKHTEGARNRVTNNVSSTQLGSQNPRVTVCDVYDVNKGKDPKKMTKMQRMAAESVKNLSRGGGSTSGGARQIQDKMLLKPKLKRPGS